jgi:hypothetical protein
MFLAVTECVAHQHGWQEQQQHLIIVKATYCDQPASNGAQLMQDLEMSHSGIALQYSRYCSSTTAAAAVSRLTG